MTLSDFVGEFKAGGEALDAIVRLAAEAGPASARQALSRIAREQPELAARWLLLSALFNPDEGWDNTVRHGLDGHPEAALLLKALDRLHAPPVAPHQEHVLAHLEQWLHKLAPAPSHAAPEPVHAGGEDEPGLVQEETREGVISRLETFWHRLHRHLPATEPARMAADAVATVGDGDRDEPGLAREGDEILARLETFWHRLRNHALVAARETAPVEAAEREILPEEGQTSGESRAPLPGARVPGDTTPSVLAQLELLLQRVQGRGGQGQAVEPPRALTDLMRFHQALLRWEARV